MRQILYAMQFREKAAPANESGTALKANTTAPQLHNHFSNGTSRTKWTIAGDRWWSGELRVRRDFHRRDIFSRVRDD